jgi:hypothetical protein
MSQLDDGANSKSVDFLILGAGWTSNFLIPALKKDNISFAATSTTGHDDTIPFKFDSESSSKKDFEVLPEAKTILITFPLKGSGQSKTLTSLYHETHTDTKPHWIQLGSTGVYTNEGWSDHKSPHDKSNARAIAEDELLSLGSSTVLNLAGLYDDVLRRPQNWVSRVARCKADVKGKQSLHLIHGRDVARGIIGSHQHVSKIEGQRWILTDLFSYDWWGLLMAWGGTLADGSDIRTVVLEVMREEGVRALTRTTGDIGRALDARAFWEAIGTVPGEGSVYHK